MLGLPDVDEAVLGATDNVLAIMTTTDNVLAIITTTDKVLAIMTTTGQTTYNILLLLKWSFDVASWYFPAFLFLYKYSIFFL